MASEWAEWTTYLSMYSVIIPVTIVLFKRNNIIEVQRWIGLLVLITLLSEIIINFLSSNKINSLPAVHLFTALQFAVLALVLGKGLSPLFSSRFLKGLIITFILFVISDAIFLNGITNFNSFSRPLASFILIFLSLCFFQKTLKELKIKSLDKEPLFWVNIGVLIYFSGSLFIFLFTNYIKASNDALLTLWGIHAIFNIILNISYSIALWIRPAN